MTQPLTFDTLNLAWNALRTSGVQAMRERLPSLQDPTRFVMTRVSETPFVLTVMIRGFDQALADVETGIPLAKRFFLDWIRAFGASQIMRGGDDSLVIRILKESRNPMETPTVESTEPKVRTGPLVHITNVRNVHGD